MVRMIMMRVIMMTIMMVSCCVLCSSRNPIICCLRFALDSLDHQILEMIFKDVLILKMTFFVG